MEEKQQTKKEEYSPVMLLHLNTYYGVEQFKSVRRAIRRGNCTITGIIVPKRPFNNRGNTSERSGKHSREFNELKKSIYGTL